MNLLHHVFRATSSGIVAEAGNHATDFTTRKHFMRHFYRQCICHKLMMERLLYSLVIVLFAIFDQSAAIIRVEPSCIDLVKWQPIVYDITVIFKQGTGVAAIELDQFAIFPATIFIYQMYRDSIMQHCYKNFNAVFLALFKYGPVIGQPLRIGGRVISVWKQARPAYRHPVDLHAHFGKQGNIFLIVVVLTGTPSERIITLVLTG